MLGYSLQFFLRSFFYTTAFGADSSAQTKFNLLVWYENLLENSGLGYGYNHNIPDDYN